MTRRYPEGMAVELEPPLWVSQYDAAGVLGVNIFRIGYLIAHDHLDPAETASREMGVTRASLDEELRWWREASRLRRWLLRPLRDSVNSF